MNTYMYHFMSDLIQIATNGIISFGAGFYIHTPVEFPGPFSDVADAYLVAPFWSDNDIRLDGEIFYEVHVAGNNSNSDQILSQVSAFVSNQTADDFTGTWMLVVQWDEVNPFPAGSSFIDFYQYLYYYFYGEYYDDLEDVRLLLIILCRHKR